MVINFVSYYDTNVTALVSEQLIIDMSRRDMLWNDGREVSTANSQTVIVVMMMMMIIS